MGLDAGLSQAAGRTLLDEVFDQAYDDSTVADGATEGKSSDSMLFKQIPVTGNAYTSEQLMHSGYFVQRAELQPMPQATTRSGNRVVTDINEFNHELPISRTFMDDDASRFGVVQKSIRGMAVRARRSSDRYMFGLFRGFTSTTDTNDGADWASNSHSTLGGVTVDNLETGTLSPTNLETMITAFAQQPAIDGVRLGKTPKLLVVPLALLREAYETTDSQLRPDTANNAINYISRAWPGMEIRFSVFISAAEGGTDTQYHLLGDDHSAQRLVRESLWTTMVPWEGQSNNQYLYKAGYREARKVVSYEQSQHSNGTV